MQTNQMKDSNSSEKSQMNLEQVLEIAFQEIRELKVEVERLKSPQLMYRRPGAEAHEKVTDYLDDVDARLKILEYSDK
tara:strand:- start:2730 stop:2963 length:234 start_codon:yes stop_codon:yes gene_type:complete